MNITDNLSWSSHITTIYANASKTLGSLRNSSVEVRKLAYLTFARPQLEFASAVWSPHHKYFKNMLERIQKRAVRYITQNYDRNSSITQIILDVSLQPLTHIARLHCSVYFTNTFTLINHAYYPLKHPRVHPLDYIIISASSALLVELPLSIHPLCHMPSYTGMIFPCHSFNNRSENVSFTVKHAFFLNSPRFVCCHERDFCAPCSFCHWTSCVKFCYFCCLHYSTLFTVTMPPSLNARQGL